MLIAALILVGMGSTVIYAQEGCIGVLCEPPERPDRDNDGIPDDYDDCPDDPTNECFCDTWENGGAQSTIIPLLYYGLIGLISPVHAAIALAGGAIVGILSLYCLLT